MENVKDIKTDIYDLIENSDDKVLLEFVHQILYTQMKSDGNFIDSMPEHEKEELYQSLEDSFKPTELRDFTPSKYKSSKGTQ